jgi:ribonuclease BN (tRNA processing enzyme)
LEITVVGSGTVVPHIGRRQSCVVVEAGGETLVFDLGSGAVRGIVRVGLDPFAVDRIFFTHFHPDHTVDVVNLLFAIKYGAERERTLPLHLAGPEPFRGFWDSVLAVWGDWMSGDYPTHVFELPREGAARHSPESIAFRLDGPDGAFVYTGDTEYSGMVVELARGAHTLLTECTRPDDDPLPNHLTPSGAAQIAREAGVERLVLTHLQPAVDNELLPSRVREGYDGEVLVAKDGLRLRV